MNTICSLNLFEQHCQRTPLSARLRGQLCLLQEYIEETLERQAAARAQRGETYTEPELWEIVKRVAAGGQELVAAGLKEPLLSPAAIKVGPSGVKVGEWEFSHFFEDLNEEPDEDTNFFEEGEAYVKQTSSRLRKPQYEYNILTSYYWAPEGTAALQNAVACGKPRPMEQPAPNSQLFSLGMTLLHLCLLRPLYQAETFSERKIQQYLQEAVSWRRQSSLALSAEFVQLLEKLLRWDSSERISYEQLGELSNLRNSFTAVSVLTREEQESKVQVVRSMLLAKEVDSGVMRQGGGDETHPLE